jgi:pimeloyl-ACP methyl ester carboxylesterase
VLLIHAGIADRTMWAPQWEAWGERFTLLRFDQRGFGESADPEPGSTWSPHGDAIEVLDAAGFDRAAVVGASFGGQAAIDLALEAPGRVAALVAVGATPSGTPDDPELTGLFEEVEDAYESGGAEAANEIEMRMWMDGTRPAGSCDPVIRDWISRTNRRLLVRQAELFEQIEFAAPEPPAAARLGTIQAPVAALAGEQDLPAVLAATRGLAAATGGEATLIGGAAHLPSLEQPADFERAVLPFLEASAR